MLKKYGKVMQYDTMNKPRVEVKIWSVHQDCLYLYYYIRIMIRNVLYNIYKL